MYKKVPQKQKVLDSYMVEYPFLRKKDDFSLSCTTCRGTFSVAHSGVYDITSHIGTKKHQNASKEMSKITPIDQFSKGVQRLPRDNVTNAECLMVACIIEHNLPLSLADHLSPLFAKMFPDSKIAKDFNCKRTKAGYIVHEFCHDTTSKLAETLKTTPFSVSTDGSADKGGKNQLYPVVVRYYNKDLEKVVTEVLCIPPMTEVSFTGENIFKLVGEKLEEHGLNWQKCLCFCSDNLLL
jgi:hypothetical protein